MTLFSLVFLFNLAMLLVTTLRITSMHLNCRPEAKGSIRKVACNVLAITCLLGTTWGLIFFSFGHLPTPGLYLFCILNFVQGFFLFLWFCAMKVKTIRSPSSNLTLHSSVQKP
ncbi:adhesion G-protein coupled receptor G5-like [Scleropages formosus]|uniref:adhesion G-protein coupled receptor G5-like n=1 Tax=Scleropages formosus TaxID=113540 RepID=UPI0006398C86|nr:adhesion G-protein coupled receptor G5-like [Scleropages formosus]